MSGRESSRSKTGRKQKTTADLRTTVAPVEFTKERTTVGQQIRTKNPVQRVKCAQELAATHAQLNANITLQTGSKCYRAGPQVSRGVFGFVYEATEKGGKHYFLRTEPAGYEEFDQYKTLKVEMAILRKCERAEAKGEVNGDGHMPHYVDSGATADFKFLVTEATGPDFYEITRKKRNNRAFSFATALRVSLQMVECLRVLHTIGFVHRFLRPQTFAHGLGRKIRTVMMRDFGLPFAFRNEKTGAIHPPRPVVRMMGSLRYCSRHSHLLRELARRDDMESWAYLSLEFFDLTALPWRSEPVCAEVLDQKQRLVDGEQPLVFRHVGQRFPPLLRYVTNMKFPERPNYDYLTAELRKIGDEHSIAWSSPFDWEVLDTVSVNVPAASVEKAARPHPATLRK
ncbi:Protein kinase domain-containing protein [Aphelenchoides fujianensis]|nr:Protein kinase domain-containing protein [Aphelenchoides fujianensis]